LLETRPFLNELTSALGIFRRLLAFPLLLLNGKKSLK
jgi:hypothetical protein